MLDNLNYARAPSSVQLLLDHGERLGLSSSMLLQGTGLQRQHLADANTLVSSEQELAVITHLVHQLPRPGGHGLRVGMTHQLTAYGILGYGMMSSATGLHALALGWRFMSLTYAFVDIRFSMEKAFGILRFKPPQDMAPVLACFVVERAMAATARIMSDLMGPDFALTRSELCAPRKPWDEDMPRQLLGCDIAFEAGENLLAFQLADLQHPLPHANAITAAMCEQLCTELSEKRRLRLTTARVVRECLLHAPPHDLPDLPALAALLHVSERTLKRKLQQESTSYSVLLSEVRLQLAQQLLATEMSLSRVAETLGFADLSTFSQTYKRWTGLSPSAGRQHLMDEKGNM